MRRRGFEKLNLKIISTVVLILFFFTISIGYSYLKQQLNIYGKSTKIAQKIEKNENGYSTYTWQIDGSEKLEGTEYTIYDVSLKIVNMDSDISSWVVSFDVPNGYSDEMSTVPNASTKKYDHGCLTLHSKDENRYISKGSTLNIKMKLAFKDGSRINLENLSLNGKQASNYK